MRAPPPEPLTMMSGNFSRVASSAARVSFSPTTEPMLPAMKAKSVTREDHGPAADITPPDHGRIRIPVLACSALRRSWYSMRSLNSSGSSGRRSVNHSSKLSSSSS